ncbi:unnamed protein product [Brachionus calyciflorus]|uniref:Uncharacterized protein n=1 Tax=Brachionus calyciflorus TaxID=104777 RepID=A0A814HZ57_9BILA|nr:unnamed protein product [Brachionus calyciflorus]
MLKIVHSLSKISNWFNNQRLKEKKSGCDDMIENSNKDYNAFSFDKSSEEEKNEEDIYNLDEEKETKKIT